MNRDPKKWETVHTHRGYNIKHLNGATWDFNYIVDDPAFLPDYKRYNTIAEAVEDIDRKTI